MKVQPIPHVPALDGCRALAVFGVLVAHFGFGQSYISNIVELVPWGHIGVRFFFVLSGFLITGILLNCRELLETEGISASIVLRQFYARRFLRIFPLFYGVLFIIYILDVQNVREIILYHVFFLSNTSSALTGTLEGFAPLIDPTTAHFWSLAVEEQFYLLWPFAVLFLSRNRLPIILLIIIISAPILRTVWFIAGFDQMYAYLPLYIDTLGAGALLALYRNGYLSEDIWKKSYVKPILIISFAIFIGSSYMHAIGVGYRVNVIVIAFVEAVLFAFIINAILDNRYNKLNRFLEISPLVYIGKISYGVYVLHAFMPLIFKKYFVEYEEGILTFIIYSAMTILGAAISYAFYENPINKLKKYFPYNYKSKVNYR